MRNLFNVNKSDMKKFTLLFAALLLSLLVQALQKPNIVQAAFSDNLCASVFIGWDSTDFGKGMRTIILP